MGGLLSGLFTAPLKLVKRWQFEQIWMVYAIYGMVVFPWVLVGFLVPALDTIYGAASTQSLALTVLFGFLWGLGSVTFGLGTAAVGNALGFALILGMTSAIGAALPLLVQHPDEAGAKTGIFTWAGLVVVAAGLGCLGYAGMLKEREQKAELAPLLAADSDRTINSAQDGGGKSAAPPSFRMGLLYCLLSGIFSPMLNLSLSFGKDIGDVAKDQGVSDLTSNNTIWALGVSSGFVANFSYCLYLLFKNKSWSLFEGSAGMRLGNTLLGVTMGALWFGGNMLYGIGVNLVGDLGSVVGWPIFLSCMIVAANLLAIFTGEWKGVTRRPKLWTAAGLLLQIAAVVIISLGSI